MSENIFVLEQIQLYGNLLGIKFYKKKILQSFDYFQQNSQTAPQVPKKTNANLMSISLSGFHKFCSSMEESKKHIQQWWNVAQNRNSVLLLK